MKQIMAIIRPNMLERVEHALHGLDHFPGFTTLRVTGRSRGRAPGHHYQPTEWDIDESDRTMLVLVCTDELVAEIVDTVRSAARTGLPGDGLIVVTDVVEVVRIRTDEHGEAAL
jgi:nitrogen regulatory protein P-II 1